MEKLLIYGKDPGVVAKLLIDSSLAAAALGRRFETEVTIDHLEALRVATLGVNYLLTDLDWKSGAVNGVYPGISIAKTAWDLGTDKGSIAIFYSPKLPPDTPPVRGVLKLPVTNLRINILRRLFEGSSPPC